MGLLVRLFGSTGWEFGYRTGKEVACFVHWHKNLSGDDWVFEDAIDAQIVQKLMPKLNGSEDKLRGILCALAWLSSGFVKIPDQDEGEPDNLYYARLAGLFVELTEKLPQSTPEKLYSDFKEKKNPLIASGSSGEKKLVLAEAAGNVPGIPKYPLTFDKTIRMWKALKANGFTSFAEN